MSQNKSKTSCPRIIGITIGDNDFHTTIRAFLRGMSDFGLGNYQALNKDMVLEMFKRSAPGLYWLHQNGLQYGLDNPTGDYIIKAITRERIFFDQEVREYIELNGGWCNSEFFVLDDSNPGNPGYIYSV